MALDVLDEHARVVEAHRLVVEQAAPELDRVIELQPGGLVCGTSKGSRVRAAEAVHGKALHRREELVRNLARHSVGEAALDECTLER